MLFKTLPSAVKIYEDGIYRTPNLLPIFHSKLLAPKEKKLPEVEQLFEKNEELMECSASGMIIEPLQKLLSVLSVIKVHE
jgi:hypothetical protein